MDCANAAPCTLYVTLQCPGAAAQNFTITAQNGSNTWSGDSGGQNPTQLVYLGSNQYSLNVYGIACGVNFSSVAGSCGPTINLTASYDSSFYGGTITVTITN